MTLVEEIKTDIFTLACEYEDLVERYKTLKHPYTTDSKDATYIHDQKGRIEKVWSTLLHYVKYTEGTTNEILDELARKANHAETDKEYSEAEQEFKSRLIVID
jgi:hypothetical protein